MPRIFRHRGCIWRTESHPRALILANVVVKSCQVGKHHPEDRCCFRAEPYREAHDGPDMTNLRVLYGEMGFRVLLCRLSAEMCSRRFHPRAREWQVLATIFPYHTSIQVTFLESLRDQLRLEGYTLLNIWTESQERFGRSPQIISGKLRNY